MFNNIDNIPIAFPDGDGFVHTISGPDDLYMIATSYDKDGNVLNIRIITDSSVKIDD